MYPFRILVIGLIVMANASCQESTFNFKSDHFLVNSNGDKNSAAAADYLFQHLNKRTTNPGNLKIGRSDIVVNGNTVPAIYLEIVPDLKHDYRVDIHNNTLSLYTKDRRTMNWLIYQLISHLGDFHSDLNVSDLPPAYISFQTTERNFDFSYRDPHIRPNLDIDYPGIIGTNSVDHEWGLWGHNLHQILEEVAEDSMFALVDGKRNPEQYCFSSDALYKRVHEYILDEHGDGQQESVKFMIAPQDNDLVCECDLCTKKGTTNTNASPAVADFLNQLAEDYPGHLFFTMSYKTTTAPPIVQLKPNAGIFLSTIELPKGIELHEDNQKVKDFLKVLKGWKAHTGNLYLWDYIANFDDYLTPYPTLMAFQKQAPFFVAQGITGVFQNGSGYDYTPFDDVKTYVLSALMVDSQLDVATLVKKYFQKFYPNSHSLLSNYYLTLEDKSSAKGIPFPIYGSFRDACSTYFDPKDFLIFYQELESQINQIKNEEERERLTQMITALSYTKLQLIYHQEEGQKLWTESTEGTKLSPEIPKSLAMLLTYRQYPDLSVYKEEDGQISDYIKQWENFSGTAISRSNLIFGKTLTVHGASSEEHEPIKLLTDGTFGFSSDFNQGWYIANRDLQMEIPASAVPRRTKTMQVRFLVNHRHRMLPPESLQVFADGKLVAQTEKRSFEWIDGDKVAIAHITLPVQAVDKLEFIVKKSQDSDRSLIACDEVLLLD